MGSEKNENSHLKSETTVLGNLKNLENTNESGLQGLGSSCREEGPSNALFVCNLIQGFPTPMLINKSSLVPGQSDQIPAERFSITSEAWDTTLAREDDTMALTLSSSSFKTSDTVSPLCNKDRSLHPSVKALRRSKKRVRAVISTELPFLIEKEFPIDKENDHCVIKRYADVHRTRWSSLFDQMDKSLFVEEKQLVSILDLFKILQFYVSLHIS